MRLRISCPVAAAVLLLCLASGLFRHAAAQGADPFDRGTGAFRAGDYAGALGAFLEARRAGLDTPSLHYNLGVTFYRLGRYEEAEREFEALVPDPQWAPLAFYNLGLAAQRAGRRQQAIERFERALRITTDPNLRTLATVALERLGSAPPSKRSGSVLSLGGGYDSNVPLSPDAATAGVSHQGDAFAEGLAGASYRLQGNAARAWDVNAGLVLRRYQDLRQFDLAGLRLGLSHETDSPRWLTSAGVFFDSVYIGGDRYSQGAGIDLQARRRLDAGGDLRARYQFERVAGGGGLEYLDGWVQRLTADAGFGAGPVFGRLGYELELNNRRDLQLGSDFSSYSPTRNSVYATVFLPEAGGWRADARVEYRLSRYDDPYILNGGTVAIDRRDDRYGIAARVDRRLDTRWRAFLDYSYYRNKSTLDTYDYVRQQVMAGVEVELGR